MKRHGAGVTVEKNVCAWTFFIFFFLGGGGGGGWEGGCDLIPDLSLFSVSISFPPVHLFFGNFVC